MVSRSNYIAITLLMCVVLIMFQLTGITENVLLNTGENVYSSEAVTEKMARQEQQTYEQQTKALLLTVGEENCVGLVGDSEEECLKAGRNWCIMQKKEYCYYSTLTEAAEDTDGAGFLIISGRELGTDEDAEALEKLTGDGRDIIVSGLPDVVDLKENAALMQALGILDLEDDEVTISGVKLFSGLLIGGETVYKDYEQKIPYVKLEDSVTAYAVAWAEDGWVEELENEDLPALIWRYSLNQGKVYVVNGDYLNGQLSAGLLTGFAADSEEYYLYPVVNAQVSIVENYPMIAKENTAVMEQEYGQDSDIVFRDILWPSIVAVYYDTDDVMTVTGAVRLDYSQDGDVDESLLQYYYEQITKMSGEIGMSGYQVSDIPLEEKLQQDIELYEEVLPDYEILTFQAGELEDEEYEDLIGEGNLLEDVNTVLTDYRENGEETFFSYLDNGVLKLPIYMDSRWMNDDDDFRSRCLQTAYGYYGTALDTSKVIYPDSENDSWNIISNDWSKNYRPYRVPFECFEKTTASEADRRVRNYLALDFETEVSQESEAGGEAGAERNIKIRVDAPDEESYFVFRLHGEEITGMTGGSFEEIEDGWYLLTITEDSAEVSVKQMDHADYYIE